MTKQSQILHYRNLNKAYYTDLERIHKLLVPPGLRILEIGSGSGDLLSSLDPAHGVGVEINPYTCFISIERNKNLIFWNFNA